LILGENAAGKSSILEAIALALAPVESREALKLDERELVLSPDHFGEVNVPPKDVATVTLDLIEGARSHTKKICIGARGSKAPLGQSDEEVPVFAYGAFRKYGSNGRAGSRASHIRNLFDAADLENPERWLLGLSDDRFAMVTRALRTIFSIEDEFEVISRDKERKQCFLVTAVDDNHHPIAVVPLRMASSGFRSVLAMMCDVMRGLMNRRFYRDFESLNTARGVVLIDEIEAHLHPRWKISIIGALRQALPQMTFILTTHDPLCLRGMAAREVVVVRRTRLSQGTTAGGLKTIVEVFEGLPSTSMYRVEQLLTSDLFQLNSTDDPDLDMQLTRIADLLSGGELDSDERRAVEMFKRDIACSMPVGTSEAQRIVQEAVAEYLQERAKLQVERMSERRVQVKRRIIDALRGTA